LRIADIGNDAANSLAYLVTYVVPLIGLGAGDPYELASVGLLVAIIGVVYVESEMITVNPTLMLFGFHIYKIVYGDKQSGYLVSRQSISAVKGINGGAIHAVQITKNVFLEKK
jgi:hypothetical protein